MLAPLTDEEINFINSVNAFRVANGVPPVQVSVTLTQAARGMANDMATNNYLSHTDSLGRTTFQRLDAFGYTCPTRGEVITADTPSGVQAFIQLRDLCDPNPDGTCTFIHRDIMLDPDFIVMGVGVAYNPNSTYRYYWVADFGGCPDVTIPIPTLTPVAAAQNVANTQAATNQVRPRPVPIPVTMTPQGNVAQQPPTQTTERRRIR